MHRSPACFVATALALSLLAVTGCGEDDNSGETAAQTTTEAPTGEPDPVEVTAVPVRYVGRRVEARLGADIVEVLDGSCTVVSHSRLVAKGSE